jgi:hypothetical protein
MKSLLFSLLTVLIVGCGSNGFQPPCADLQTPGLISHYFPLAQGNKWVYNVVKNVDGKQTVSDYTLEICDSSTIYFIKDGNRVPFTAYRACRDGEKSDNYYFVKCADGTHLLTVNDWYYKELQTGWLIPNNPQEGEKVEHRDDLVWRGQEMIKVPSGEFQVWVLEEIRELSKREMKLYNHDKIDGDKTVRTRYYFAEGVGLIKTEIYGAPGELLTVMEIKDYKLKNTKGSKVR